MAATNKIVAVIKKNPKKSALFIGVGLIGVVYFARRGSSASNDSEVSPDGFAYGTGQYTDSMMAFGIQQQQIQAGITGQSNQLNAQLAAIDANNNFQLEIAQLDTHTKELGITTAYNIAMLESAERVHGLDQAADIARLQSMQDYTLKDKALNYQNENQVAQNAILQSQVDATYNLGMKSLSNEELGLNLQYNFGLASLQSQKEITEIQTRAAVKIANYGVNAANSAGFFNMVGGLGQSLASGLAAWNANTGSANTAPKETTTSKSDAGSNKKSGG